MFDGSDAARGQTDSRPAHHSHAWTPCVEAWFPSIYDCLHDLAERRLQRESVDHTLQPTALVHEAYVRLAEADHRNWKNQAHFFAVAAQTLRHVLVDHARRKASAKRGGHLSRVALDTASQSVDDDTVDILALDEALTELAANHERASRVVELRYFSGMTVNEAADALDTSPSTVKMDWRFACAWLNHRLRERP